MSPVGDAGVLVALGSLLDGARDQQAELRSQLVRDLLAHDHLHDARGLAQVDERDAAVVAPPRHPSGEGDPVADVLGAQASGVVGADHF